MPSYINYDFLASVKYLRSQRTKCLYMYVKFMTMPTMSLGLAEQGYLSTCLYTSLKIFQYTPVFKHARKHARKRACTHT